METCRNIINLQIKIIFTTPTKSERRFERSSLPGKFWPARKASRVSNCLEEPLGEIALAVKTRPNPTWTKRPRGALL